MSKDLKKHSHEGLVTLGGAAGSKYLESLEWKLVFIDILLLLLLLFIPKPLRCVEFIVYWGDSEGHRQSKLQVKRLHVSEARSSRREDSPVGGGGGDLDSRT